MYRANNLGKMDYVRCVPKIFRMENGQENPTNGGTSGTRSSARERRQRADEEMAHRDAVGAPEASSLKSGSVSNEAQEKYNLIEIILYL